MNVSGGPRRRALLLDRDGVINVDHGYVCQQEQVQFIDGIFDLVRVASERCYAIIVITNQAGIGRGLYTEEEFHSLTAWMSGVFREHGTSIDRVYWCADHPEHGVGAHRADSRRRKPAPGMILDAARDFALDLSASVLVGDKESDILAGVAAGVGINLLFAPTLPHTPTAATATIATLRAAAQHLRR